MTDFTITGAEALLTGLDGEAARASGSVRVRGGRIAAIGDLAPEPDERVVDATNCVVTPGFACTHHHLFQSVLKAIPEAIDARLAEWLRLVPYGYAPRLDEDALRVSARIGLAECVLSGCTTVADHHYYFAPHWEFDACDVLFEEAARFGVRFVLARGGATRGRTFDDGQTAPVPTETLDGMLASVEALAARHHDARADAMTRVAFAPTAPTFTMEPGQLKEAAAAARAMGLRIHSHLSENTDYVDYTRAQDGQRPVPWLAQYDWLGPDVWYAHLVECTPGEVAMLAETGTGMAHCPQANWRLASGVAPAPALHEAGGTVSLAIDGAGANEAADMFSTLYAAFSVHRAATKSIATRAETVLSWATRGGARVLGLETGTLAVGMPADIAVLDLNEPRYFGQHDRAIGPVVSSGGRVRHSFVAGRPVVEDERIPWLDLDELGARARETVDRLRR